MANFLECNPQWTRKPAQTVIKENTIEMITEPGTDLWARTYVPIMNFKMIMRLYSR